MTKDEYQKVGSVALGEKLKAKLEAEGCKPYVIPVGRKPHPRRRRHVGHHQLLSLTCSEIQHCQLQPHAFHLLALALLAYRPDRLFTAAASRVSYDSATFSPMGILNSGSKCRSSDGDNEDFLDAW